MSKNSNNHSSRPDAVKSNGMPDMQKSRDDRNIAIDKVGVKDIHYPDRGHGQEQRATADGCAHQHVC